MQLGVDYILNALAAEGADHLFMVPGGLVDPFLPALGKQSALKPVVAAQEGGAAYMADGYARASGKFGAALCIGGPGLANAVTAVAAAQTDGSPVFLMSGEVSTLFEGLGMFQDASAQTLDDVEILKPIVRYSSSIDNPKNLPHLFKHAMLQLKTRPSGPVHLSLPGDSQIAEISAVYAPIEPALANPASLSLAAAEASLERFRGSSADKPPARIVILAGAGVEHANASRPLRDFAERWGIPVATTLRAKGVFPEDHPLSLGVFGYAGTHHARIALLDAPPDLLIILGSGLNERDTMHWSLEIHLGATICVNLNPASIGMHANAGAVVGDCGAYLSYLLGKDDELAALLRATAAGRAAWLADIRARPRLQDRENCASDAVPIHPARVIGDLRKAFPRDGILVVDSGAHRAFAGHYWDSYEPRTYISATNLGPMGWAIAAASGVQCAQPGRRVAVITGDGCMRMNGIEVATAAHYGLPVIFVVMNNAALGNVWLRAHALGPVPDELTRLPDHDWAAFAAALGCRGETVRRPGDLAAAFERALEGPGPCVIDVKIDRAFGTPVHDWAAASAAFSYHE
ncbi:thiamine pyrophosphate-binding protein [Methylocapsa palsarum]|uniref:Acetolactate synthase-1/2/3 large subunit n=1 Tax=Methylocapsa palsarum TaxID=1612308 RepID=A0A1I3ZXA8_9HYPH|nr:thiamine pyrophosphate-binding protein [Methylocapsa palsarum]SFK48276.1 acetolactate synthase-1/2/3 large subunit [Methylocapsa palsarum]